MFSHTLDSRHNLYSVTSRFLDKYIKSPTSHQSALVHEKSLASELVHFEYLKNSKMKTFAVATCVLLFVALVYARDEQARKKFQDDLAACSQELGVPAQPVTGALIKCTAMKDDKIYDAQTGMKEEGIYAKIDKLIADPSNSEKALSLTRECITEAIQAGGTNDEMLTKATDCGAEKVMPFL